LTYDVSSKNSSTERFTKELASTVPIPQPSARQRIAAHISKPTPPLPPGFSARDFVNEPIPSLLVRPLDPTWVVPAMPTKVKHRERALTKWEHAFPYRTGNRALAPGAWMPMEGGLTTEAQTRLEKADHAYTALRDLRNALGLMHILDVSTYRRGRTPSGGVVAIPWRLEAGVGIDDAAGSGWYWLFWCLLILWRKLQIILGTSKTLLKQLDMSRLAHLISHPLIHQQIHLPDDRLTQWLGHLNRKTASASASFSMVAE
jgi:hypothetical protein